MIICIEVVTHGLEDLERLISSSTELFFWPIYTLFNMILHGNVNVYRVCTNVKDTYGYI